MKNIIRGKIASFWRDFPEPVVDGERAEEHWAGGSYSCLRTGGALYATYTATWPGGSVQLEEPMIDMELVKKQTAQSYMASGYGPGVIVYSPGFEKGFAEDLRALMDEEQIFSIGSLKAASFGRRFVRAKTAQDILERSRENNDLRARYGDNWHAAAKAKIRARAGKR